MHYTDMDIRKRYLFIVNLIVSAIAVVFIAVALGTEYWIVASPERIVDDDVEEGAKNVTGGNPGDKFKGEFHAGLFAGEKILDQGLGDRYTAVKVECREGENSCYFKDVDQATDSTFGGPSDMRYQQRTVRQQTNDTGDTDDDSTIRSVDIYYNMGLWVSTILFAVLAICWGLVACVFSIVNASIRPIETITGPAGLYLWNGIAAFCSTLCIILYVVLFVIDLSENILTPQDIENRWTSRDRVTLDFSFYFIVVATVLFLVNISIMALSGIECKKKKSFAATMSSKALDGTMMF